MWCTDRRIGAGVAIRGRPMALGYFAIFGSSLAAYAGVGPWVIAAAAIALAALSRAEHEYTYERGRQLGGYAIVDSAMLRSLLNGLMACAAAYSFGCLMRII
jgi:hypothetical protein